MLAPWFCLQLHTWLSSMCIQNLKTVALIDAELIIIIWKAQGVPQLNNVAHPKQPEEKETSPNRNHIITGKQQQTN